MPATRGLLIALLGVTVSCGPGTKEPTRPHRPDESMQNPERLAPVMTPPADKPKAIATPALLAAPLPNDPSKTTIHRLSNGMTVYLSPDPQEPTIVAHIAVKAGSANDPEISTGLAHYLEHMLFKGTSKLGTLDYANEKVSLDKIAGLYADLRKPGADRPAVLKAIDAETQKAAALAVPNELDQMYSRMGITGLNAYTNIDATVYVSEIPKNRIAQWARVEAARYSDAVFRLFWPELEAVYEEKNRGLDNAPRRVYEAFVKALYPKHGYGRPTLGEIEHLKSPAYGDMEAFFQRYYTPQNMAILLSGDVDASVLPLLEKEFGAWKRPAGDANEPGALPPLSGRSEVTVQVPSDEGIMLGWHLVSATAKDRSALELMDLLLLDGQSGILARELLIPQKVADAGCGPTFLREAGYYDMHADSLAGQTPAELEKLLLDLVGKVQRGEFTDTDLATAILTAEIQDQRQVESNQGRMAMMENAFVFGDEWANSVTRIERFRAVTRADIVRVAKQYLTGNFVVVKKVKGTATPPKITKPGITPVKLDASRRSAFAKAVLEMPVSPIEPVALKVGQDYARGTLSTGEIISVKNPRNGLFSIAYEYEYGRINDRLACLALEVLKVSGAGKRSAEQVSRQLHELGLSIDTQCGKTESAIVISGVDRNLEAGMTLLREWLADPGLDDAILKARVTAALTERANQVASPQSIAGAQQLFAAYGKDSDTLVVASNKQLQAATPAQLKKLLAGFLTMKHRTSYFGPRATSDKAVLAAITLGTGKLPTRTRAATRYRAPNALFATDLETAQTHVWMVWPRQPATAQDRAAGALFGEYIQPILYQEVREARGLAYTVFGGYTAGSRTTDAASVFVYTGTQGDKTHDAIDAILGTLGQGVDDNRLLVAKETITQNHRIERIAPRAIAGVVYQWEDEGELTDPREARTQRTLAIDGAGLGKWMTAALKAPVIVSVTGDRKKLDDAKLKKLAPVTSVPVATLFGF